MNSDFLFGDIFNKVEQIYSYILFFTHEQKETSHFRVIQNARVKNSITFFFSSDFPCISPISLTQMENALNLHIPHDSL